MGHFVELPLNFQKMDSDSLYPLIDLSLTIRVYALNATQDCKMMSRWKWLKIIVLIVIPVNK